MIDVYVTHRRKITNELDIVAMDVFTTMAKPARPTTKHDKATFPKSAKRTPDRPPLSGWVKWSGSS
jgi:hypothetical protein